MSFARSPLWNAFIASTIAAPILKATRLVHKRYPPSIASGFTAQQTTQITDAFRDALELASYALTAPSGTVDLIYTKYFNTGDRDLVNNVFNTILGGDTNSDQGNGLLGQITISPDFPDAQGGLTCADATTMAELRDWNTITTFLSP